VEGLDILPCGPIPENPSEILNSQEFGELIDRLALKYDHILFDSPPANLVTDARILGAVCDASILVLRAEKSTRKAAEHARNALLSVGANVLGVIVNDVPRGKGYEVYGGSYYGTPEMRQRSGAADYGNSSGSSAGTSTGASTGHVARLPRPTSDVAE
jgi:capsular exopolysaccharide synthesis family protein